MPELMNLKKNWQVLNVIKVKKNINGLLLMMSSSCTLFKREVDTFLAAPLEFCHRSSRPAVQPAKIIKLKVNYLARMKQTYANTS